MFNKNICKSVIYIQSYAFKLNYDNIYENIKIMNMIEIRLNMFNSWKDQILGPT